MPHKDAFGLPYQMPSVHPWGNMHHLRWVGHITHMSPYQLPLQSLYSQLTDSKRSTGGQWNRFKDHTRNLLKQYNLKPTALETLAEDLSAWRSACARGIEHREANFALKSTERWTKRHQHALEAASPGQDHPCPSCCKSASQGLASTVPGNGINQHRDHRSLMDWLDGVCMCGYVSKCVRTCVSLCPCVKTYVCSHTLPLLPPGAARRACSSSGACVRRGSSRGRPLGRWRPWTEPCGGRAGWRWTSCSRTSSP